MEIATETGGGATGTALDRASRLDFDKGDEVWPVEDRSLDRLSLALTLGDDEREDRFRRVESFSLPFSRSRSPYNVSTFDLPFDFGMIEKVE